MTVVLCAVLLTPPAGGAPGRCRPATRRVELGRWSTVPVTGITGSPAAWRMDAGADLVVVADFEGVLVSRDGGCDWIRELRFEEVAPELSLRAEDVDVVAGPDGRAVHVVAIAWSGAAARLLSSEDEGRTWATLDLPVEAVAAPLDTAELTASDAALYLTTVHRTGSGGLFSSDDDGRTWRRRALTTAAVPPGACAPGDACSAPPLRELVPDPDSPARLWALTTPSAGRGAGLVRSDNGGSAWEELDVPSLLHGPALLDVAPGGDSPTVLLLGDFGDFALSRDDGGSWEVGSFPEVSAGSQWTQESFDVAHFQETFATLLGSDRESGWAGNVMLFDGRRWTNVSPPRYAGYGSTDSSGTRLAFTELTGTGPGYLVLSSTGDLARFRPLRREARRGGPSA